MRSFLHLGGKGYEKLDPPEMVGLTSNENLHHARRRPSLPWNEPSDGEEEEHEEEIPHEEHHENDDDDLFAENHEEKQRRKERHSAQPDYHEHDAEEEEELYRNFDFKTTKYTRQNPIENHHAPTSPRKKGQSKNSKKSVVLNWSPPRNPSIATMKRLCRVNCLVRGDWDNCEGTKWLVPVDWTPASQRAFDHVKENSKPEDHIFVVHVRLLDAEFLNNVEIEEAYRRWRRAFILCKRYCDQLVAAHKKNYTVLIPIHHDHRKLIVRFTKLLNIDVVAIGRHYEEDKSTRDKNYHFRAFSNYVSKHSKCRTIIL